MLNAPRKLMSLLVLSSILAFGVLALLNLDTASKDIELIQVFNLDEGAGTWQLKQNVLARDFDPRGFYNYGYLYINASHLVVKVLGGLGFDTSDEQVLAVSLRSLSLFSWFLAGLFIFLSARNLQISPFYALLASASVLFLPKVFEYAQFVHPDLLQLMFCSLAIYIMTRARTDIMNVLLSSMILGLAFGTKYSGIFLLPIPFLFLLFMFRKRALSSMELMVYGGLCLFLFLGAWLATNPYLISDWTAFLEDFKYESEHVSRGHWRAESSNPLLWFQVIYSQFGLALSLFVPLVLSLFIITSRKSEDNTTILIWIMLITLGIALIYLMIQVNMRRPRYLFHLLPLISIPAFYGLQKLEKTLKKGFLLIFLAPLLVLQPAIESFAVFDRYSSKMDHEYVKAGLWMKANYPGHIKILSDYYSYLPSDHFNNSYHTFGITQEEIDGHQPKVIILNKSISGMRSWKANGSSFNELNIEMTDRDGAAELNQFHLKLFAPGSAWKIVYEELNIVILEKELNAPEHSP